MSRTSLSGGPPAGTLFVGTPIFDTLLAEWRARQAGAERSPKPGPRTAKKKAPAKRAGRKSATT